MKLWNTWTLLFEKEAPSGTQYVMVMFGKTWHLQYRIIHLLWKMPHFFESKDSNSIVHFFWRTRINISRKYISKLNLERTQYIWAIREYALIWDDTSSRIKIMVTAIDSTTFWDVIAAQFAVLAGHVCYGKLEEVKWSLNLKHGGLEVRQPGRKEGHLAAWGIKC